MMNQDSVKRIYESFKTTAKEIGQTYATQHKRGMEDYIIWAVDGAEPPESLIYAAEIIKELAQKYILGIAISPAEEESYMSQIKENADKETKKVIKENPLLEHLSEKIMNTEPLVLMRLTNLKSHAMAIADDFKKVGGDLEEFLAEEAPCKCGECNPNDKIGRKLTELVKDIVRSILSEAIVPNERMERWIDEIKAIDSTHEIKRLTDNINLN